jgi:hypothetical protein
MGKASSSKKVQRAARAAGRPGTGRNYLWPALVGVLVVVGLLLIVISRGKTEDSVAPKLGDHWHAAYAIYDCDTFLPPLTDVIQDTSGLHTHSDSLMHMHPFGTSYTGKGANIGNWGETTGLELTDTSFSTSSLERKNGDECSEGVEGTLQLKVWDSPDDAEGRLIEEDFADYAPQEFSMWVLAFVPEGTDIPKPPAEAIAALRAPADVVGATSSTLPPITLDTTPTTAVDPNAPTTTADPNAPTTTADPNAPSTTVPPETTASTAPPDTATTTP